MFLFIISDSITQNWSIISLYREYSIPMLAINQVDFGYRVVTRLVQDTATKCMVFLFWWLTLDTHRYSGRSSAKCAYKQRRDSVETRERVMARSSLSKASGRVACVQARDCRATRRAWVPMQLTWFNDVCCDLFANRRHETGCEATFLR